MAARAPLANRKRFRRTPRPSSSGISAATIAPILSCVLPVAPAPVSAGTGPNALPAPMDTRVTAPRGRGSTCQSPSATSSCQTVGTVHASRRRGGGAGSGAAFRLKRPTSRSPSTPSVFWRRDSPSKWRLLSPATASSPRCSQSANVRCRCACTRPSSTAPTTNSRCTPATAACSIWWRRFSAKRDAPPCATPSVSTTPTAARTA